MSEDSPVPDGVEMFKHGKLTAFGTNKAGLLYSYDDETQRYYLSELASSMPGGGKEVIQKFVAYVGSDKSVDGTITEEETLKQLDEWGLLKMVHTTNQSITVDDERLRELKLARVLSGGGIKDLKVVISPIPKDKREESEEVYPYDAEVSFEGKT